MDKEKKDVVAVSQYNEEAFDTLVEKDDDSSADDEPGLSDFPEFDDDPKGTKEGDAEKDDADSKEQPKGKQEPADDSQDDGKDDPKHDELPAWMELIPDEQRADAQTEFMQLNDDLKKINARYESQTGQLKPTQRRLARMEELVKISGALKPGDDLDKRSAELDTWIEKHGEDFPDEAATLKATLDAYRDSVSTIKGDAKKYRSTLERTDDEKVDRTLQRRNLERMDSNAREISADPSFTRYLEQNPEYAAQAKSPFAHDVIGVIDQFRKDTEWQPPMRSEEFLHIDQMLSSPIFEVWSRAIGLTAGQVTDFDATDQARVFHKFKVELDEAHRLDDEGSDDKDSNEAIELAKRRDKRKKDVSPKARGTGTGGGKAAALKGEKYFDQLEI